MCIQVIQVLHSLFYLYKHCVSDNNVFLTEGVLMKRYFIIISILMLMPLFFSCTQETQNTLGRSIQNWTGTNGVLDVYAGEKLVNRFIKIDKLSTATSTKENISRPYRFGYGYLDLNMNFKVDSGEKKVYFEFSDYSTSYIFYENPTN